MCRFSFLKLAIAFSALMGMWGGAVFTVAQTNAAEPTSMSKGKTVSTINEELIFKNLDPAKIFPRKSERSLSRQKAINLAELHGILKIKIMAALQKVMPFYQDPNQFVKLSKDPEGFARKLGFDSLDQATETIPGPILIEMRISNQSLIEFHKNKDLYELFMQTLGGSTGNSILSQRIFVPLIDPQSGQAKSSLTFQLFMNDIDFRWVSRGAPKLMQKIDKWKKRHEEKHPNDQIDRLIRVPGFNLRFLGYSSEGQEHLIPLYTRDVTTKLKYEEGQPKLAKVIFNELGLEAFKRKKEGEIRIRDIVRETVREQIPKVKEINQQREDNR